MSHYMYMSETFDMDEVVSLLEKSESPEDHEDEAKWIKGNIKRWSNASSVDASSPTDAFGEIEFEGHGEKRSKFVRINKKMSPEVALELMLKVWKIKTPNLIISVTGGARNFNMKYRLRDTFHRGIMKAAQSTGGWIITGGTNVGVMKHVGNAVREYEITSGDQNPVVAVGIATWGIIHKKEKFIDEDGSYPAVYTVMRDTPKGKSALDPNYSHFLLVDDGTENFGADIDFRAALEKTLSDMKTGGGNDVHIPVVLVVVEGGPGTLKTVNKTVKNGTPTVLIEGSGKVAKVLAYAVQNCKIEKNSNPVRGYFTARQKQDIAKIIKEELDCDDQDLADKKYVEQVEEIIEQYDLLTVFELGSEESATEIDIALLKALMKATTSIEEKLKISIALNRVDIARTDIFDEEKQFQHGESMNKIIMSALKMDRAAFVDLFQDHGFIVGRIMKRTRLLELYRDTPRKTVLYKLLKQLVFGRSREKSVQGWIANVEMEDVGRLLQRILGKYYVPYYMNRKNSPAASERYKRNTGLHGSQEVFIWAVLSNRLELAKIFWPFTRDPLGASLVANHLFNSLMTRERAGDVRMEYEEGAKWFEEQATKVLFEMYAADENKSHHSLVRKLDNWGCTSAIHLAVQAGNKKAISTIACQRLLTERWNGHLGENNIFKVLLCIFVPFLIIPLITFTDDEKDDEYSKDRKAFVPGSLRHDTSQHSFDVPPDTEENCCSCTGVVKKIADFYRAPCNKFLTNVISYIAFLGLYSFVLLTKIDYQKTSVGEVILIVWVATLMIEEIRQAFAEEMYSLSETIMVYFRERWNLADIFMIALFFVGMGLRFSTNTDVFRAGKYVLAIALLFFYIRLLHIYSIHKELGPKLVMIHKMMKDLFYFMLILAVFMGSYAIVSEAMLKDHIELTWKYVFVDLFHRAYFHIYGELFLDGDDYQASTDWGTCIVMYLLGAYMLMCNVMLLNLLIAIFSTTYQQIQDQSEEHWNWQRYNLVFEYYSRPLLPPPFIIINHLISLSRFLCFHCCKYGSWKNLSGFVKQFSGEEDKKLSDWERAIIRQYAQKSTVQSEMSQEQMTKEANIKIEELKNQIEEVKDYAKKQNDALFESLEWIVKSMQSKGLANDTLPLPSLSTTQRKYSFNE